jgi:hypothetical protein
MTSTSNNMPEATVSNQLRLAGRTAIVTGAGRGIGRAIAEHARVARSVAAPLAAGPIHVMHHRRHIYIFALRPAKRRVRTIYAVRRIIGT